jgi:hypothetical protein
MRSWPTAGVEDHFACENEDCPRCDDVGTREDIENENEARGMRAQQTGPDAWADGHARNH